MKCRECRQEQPVGEFYKCRYKKTRKSYRDARCKKCSLKRLKRWRLDNPEKNRAKRNKWNKTREGKYSAWRSHLRRVYRITPEKYLEMAINQSGLCMICEKPTNKSCLRVDHDHRTGKIRDLLCDFCNKFLGYIEKHKGLVELCENYLEKHE